MTLVAGVYAGDGAPSPDALDAMIARLPERAGPATPWRRWHTDKLSLAESGDRQDTPRYDPRDPAPPTGVLIAGHLRLHDRANLLRQLDLRPETGTPDHDLLAHAYGRWGRDCFAHLVGEFAIALWDAGRRRLLLARDPVGTRELFYARTGRRLTFGSNLNLVAAPPPDRQTMLDYLASLPHDPARTFFLGTQRLLAGHWLEASGDRVTTQPFWRPEDAPDIRHATPADYVEEYREIFLAAVADRLAGPGTIGAQLSGGLDSSAVVGAARHLRGPGADPLPVFSVVFPENPMADERPFVNALVAEGGLEPYSIMDRDLAPRDNLDRVLAQEGEPFWNPFLLVFDRLYRQAAGKGVAVMLDGMDGDSTTFNCYQYLTDLAVSGRWGRLTSELGHVANRLGISRRAALRTHVLVPLLPSPLTELYRALRGRRPLDRLRLLRPGVVRAAQLASRGRALIRAYHPSLARGSRAVHGRRIAWTAVGRALGTMDRAADAAGVEARHPFADVRLARYCLGLPPDLKLYQGWTRYVARAGMAGLAPDIVRWRPHKGRQITGFVQAMIDITPTRLGAIGAMLEEYLEPGALEREAARFSSSGDPDAAIFLWQADVLAKWLAKA